MALVADPSFWVFLSFTALSTLAGKKLWISLTGFLDARSEKICKDIEDAQRLKEEAEKLREDAIRLQHTVNKHAQEIMAHTKIEIQRLKEEASQQIEAHLNDEEHQLNQKIKLAEQQALNDIEKKVIQASLEAAKDIIRTNIDAELDNSLFDKTVKKISSISFSFESHL